MVKDNNLDKVIKVEVKWNALKESLKTVARDKLSKAPKRNTKERFYEECVKQWKKDKVHKTYLEKPTIVKK